jgi:hypothetical protein
MSTHQLSGGWAFGGGDVRAAPDRFCLAAATLDHGLLSWKQAMCLQRPATLLMETSVKAIRTESPSPLEGEGSRRRRVGEGDDLTPSSGCADRSSPSPGRRFASPALSLQGRGAFRADYRDFAELSHGTGTRCYGLLMQSPRGSGDRLLRSALEGIDLGDA